MELSAQVIQSLIALGSGAAAFFAWKAASTARTSVEIQRETLEASIEDYRIRERPRLAAVFRLVGASDILYLDLSNHGGLAVNIKLKKPVLVSENPTRSALNKLEQCVAISHGIDALRPGETLSLSSSVIISQNCSLMTGVLKNTQSRST